MFQDVRPAATDTRVVTFLMTDIEGSTPLWESDPERMTDALRRHDDRIEAVVTAHGGRLIRSKGEGDSTFSVFEDPLAGAAAAIEIQRAFDREPWPTSKPLRVRAALHTGRAYERNDDFFGPAVNLCARLRGAAHGGQIVATDATAAAISSGLPPGASLVDLGVHRFKGVARDERVFQVSAGDLRSEFPPLVSLRAKRHNLPSDLTTFVGREHELAALSGLLSRARLVTVTGPGGSGKTRIAVKLASELVDRFEDGVWFVDLAPVTSDELVAQVVASALHVQEEPTRTLVDVLEDHLSRRTVLLLADNCEHVLEGLGEIAARLLSASPTSKILATSRAPLDVGGEVTLPLAPLRVPPPDTFEGLQDYEAAALFLDRAAVARPGFTVTAANGRAVADIVRRLDGIPLAIEIAASRIRSMAPEALAKRLEDRFQVLEGTTPRRLGRHQTLRAAIDWSYALLAGDERVLFDRLSVFVGGFDLEACEAVCTDTSGSDAALSGLDSLVAKSLVSFDDRDGRYGMLETIREYAASKFAQRGERDTVRRRHLDFFVGLTSRATIELRGPEQVAWLRTLDAEHDNLRAALSTAFELGDVRAAVELAVALTPYWRRRSMHREGRTWLDRVLALAGDDLSRAAPALLRRGHLAADAGSYDEARNLAMEAFQIFEAAHDTKWMASALHVLGDMEASTGALDSAMRHYERGIALWRARGDDVELADSLDNLGTVLSALGRDREASERMSEALQIRRRRGDVRGIAISANNLGVSAQRRGEFDRARALFEQAVESLRVMGEIRGLAVALIGLAQVLDAMHDPQARELFSEAAVIALEAEDRRALAYCLEGLASVELREKRPKRAVVLLANAASVRGRFEVPLEPIEVPDNERVTNEARSLVGDEQFLLAWERGAQADPEELIR